MTIDIQIAAKQLFRLIDAPAGTVGVLGWNEGPEPKLRVFFSACLDSAHELLPEHFAGYRVVFETLLTATPFLKD